MSNLNYTSKAVIDFAINYYLQNYYEENMPKPDPAKSLFFADRNEVQIKSVNGNYLYSMKFPPVQIRKIVLEYSKRGVNAIRLMNLRNERWEKQKKLPPHSAK